ncbi:MAG TPA: HAMP domain-containing sensor histidine kinase, partial [Burkholderiales bacterium]|nr:HAMP domain-containing sensor histidine kinase [Burkholderiales bacterium]
HGYVIRAPQDRDRLPPHLRGLDLGRHELIVNKEEHHVLVRDGAGVRYYVEYEVGLHEEREAQFKLLVLLSVLTAAAVSLALGYWLSGLLVDQVTELARRVGTLKPGESREPLTRPGQDLEVETLARAFEGYQARIEEMIRREQEFTSNASHELRTPLTAIKTSCELLLAEPTLAAKTRARLEQISAAAARMTEQTQALLFLARGQAPGNIEPVALADCAEDAIEPYRGEIARKAITVESRIARDAVLDIDYQALRLVLSNLIRNAVQHTERGSICLTFSGRRLTISDSGRGIVQESLPRIFERFYSNADGTGLGLAIVGRICEMYGWRVEVESQSGAGSSFSVTFP